MPDEQFKRHVAYKLRINDILIGKPILEGERFSFLELGNKKIIRINIVGNVVDKYESEGDKKYSFITIDDGSGQIQIRAFGDDIEKLKNTTQGQTILVIGVLRYFNEAVYIFPEIIKNLPSEYLLVRKLETEKEKAQNFSQQPFNNEKRTAIKDSILDAIRNSEQKGGIDIDELIMMPEINKISPDIINQEIKKMTEQGIIFESRPGRLRWLG